MEWYGKRAHVRQSGLSWSTVEEAFVDLLQHKPYMNSPAPRPAVEESLEDDGSDNEWEDMAQEQLPDQEHNDQDMDVQVHPNTIVLPVETRPIRGATSRS